MREKLSLLLSLSSMPFSRRDFLRKSAVLGSAALSSRIMFAANRSNRDRRLNPHLLARYVDPLPIPSIARSSETRVSPSDVNIRVPYYRIEMRQFEVQLHRDLPPTSQWGYDSAVPGPTFETRRSTRRERRACTCQPCTFVLLSACGRSSCGSRGCPRSARASSAPQPGEPGTRTAQSLKGGF
jgi:hypothetical protein